MPKNKLEDLRNHLFEQLERLKDDDCNLDKEIKRSEAVAQIAQVIVNTAKAEVGYLKLAGRGESNFLNENQVNSVPKQIASFSKADKCADHAATFGHSKEVSENCENYSVGCPNCPFAS